MTIDEAIKRNEEIRSYMKESYEAKDRAAVGLGIEALKRCQEIKNYTPKDTYCPLRGETKD